MNPVERLLYDEITHLVDRVATSVAPGATLSMLTPTMQARLDQADAELATARAAMLENYGRWRQALEDAENLWALAAWRSTAAEEPREQAPALAA
jgi:hypothetical protein